MFRVSPVSTKPNINNLLAWWGVVVIVTAIGWAYLIHSAIWRLSVNAPLASADWIVVLGGESAARVIGAAELYHKGVAPNVFVSGTGDCLLNARRIEMAGVPAANIRHECSSETTYENAIYTRQSLSQFKPANIVLVTSWWHTRRALRVFQQAWPDVQFGVAGVVPGDISYDWLPIHESGVLTLEYVKSVWYWLRYSSIAKSILG